MKTNKNNELNKKKIVFNVLQLLTILVVIVFSFYSYSVISTAWFASNENINSDGMSISMSSDNNVGFGSFSVYKVDEDDNSASLYDSFSNDQLGDILTLNKYDSVFAEKRETTPILLKITLSNVSVQDEIDFNISININTENSGYYTQETTTRHLTQHFSNFINIRCSTSPLLNAPEHDVNEYYKFARDFMLNEDNVTNDVVDSQTFVSYTGTGSEIEIANEKAQSINFTITKPANVADYEIYLLFSYDEHLISKFVADNQQALGSTSELNNYFSWGADIFFFKDLSDIVVTEQGRE